MKDACRVAIASIVRAWRNNIVSRAAALAFTTMISLMPLAVLLFSMIAIFDGGDRIITFVQGKIIPHLAPDFADQLTNYLRDNISASALRHGVADGASMFAILLLMMAALQITSLSERYLNEIWQTKSTRGFLQRIGVFWVVLTLSPFALFFMMKLGDVLVGFVGNGDTTSWIPIVLGKILPVVAGFITFFVVFRVFPHTPVRPLPAVVGATVATLLWEGARQLFFLYIERQSGITNFYPKLAMVPLFLIWIWLNWVITLFGCEVTHTVQELGRVWAELVGASDGPKAPRPALALRALALLLRTHRGEAVFPDESALATATRSSPSEVVAVMRVLETSRWVVPIAGRGTWALARDPSSIRLSDVWRRILEHDHGTDAAATAVDADARRARDAAIDALGEKTLADYDRHA